MIKTECVQHIEEWITRFCDCCNEIVTQPDVYCLYVRSEHKQFKTAHQIKSLSDVINNIEKLHKSRLVFLNESEMRFKKQKESIKKRIAQVLKKVEREFVQKIERSFQKIQKTTLKRYNSIFDVLSNKIELLRMQLVVNQKLMRSEKQCRQIILFYQKGDRQYNQIDEHLKKIHNIRQEDFKDIFIRILQNRPLQQTDQWSGKISEISMKLNKCKEQSKIKVLL